jgi:hypothetical protein
LACRTSDLIDGDAVDVIEIDVVKESGKGTAAEHEKTGDDDNDQPSDPDRDEGLGKQEAGPAFFKWMVHGHHISVGEGSINVILHAVAGDVG